MKTVTAVLVFVAAAAVAVRADDQIPVGSRVGTTPASGYDDGGRRDPFLTLITAKRAATSPTRTGVGLAGLSVTDVVVTGIVRGGKVGVAILQGPDGKSFTAKAQDRLEDAVIKAIEADTVVFIAQVADAAGVAHPKEVRKSIRVVTGVGR